MNEWAEDFYEIQDTVEKNTALQEKIQSLVSDEPIHGKVLEGDGRTESLRDILAAFFESQASLDEAVEMVASALPQNESPHLHDNRVFADGWDERLVRTQASRFYNQAVLENLKEEGNQHCYVPHSAEEDVDTDCTLQLAGNEAEVDTLLDRLVRTYGRADYHNEVKIPNHPHCTHTVVPSDFSD